MMGSGRGAACGQPFSHLLVEAADWVSSELAVYDLGQAVAQMSF